MLARNHLQQGDAPQASQVAAEYAKRFPTSDVIAVLQAKCLVANQRYQQAAALLNNLNLLPCEGSTEAHSLFREANLMLVREQFESGAYAEALKLIGKAREWPEHLGSGKPYPEEIDERLDDWLEYQCQRHLNPNDAQKSLNKILTFIPRQSRRNIGEVVRALALKQSGKQTEARQLLESWSKEEPTNQLAKWGNELVVSGSAPLPAELQSTECRVLAASLR